MQWEEEWKATMSELEGDSKIPDLWRMSALMDMCPTDVKEQMMMRPGEMSDNYENLKSKVVSHTDASVTRTERDACGDGGCVLEWQRTRTGALGRCGRRSKGFDVLQLPGARAFREGFWKERQGQRERRKRKQRIRQRECVRC